MGWTDAKEKYGREYYKKHREERMEYQKQYYEEHKEQHSKYAREYYRKNRDKISEKNSPRIKFKNTLLKMLEEDKNEKD